MRPVDDGHPIIVRGRLVLAEHLYTSGRGDYVVYRYRGKVYVVRTDPPGGGK